MIFFEIFSPAKQLDLCGMRTRGRDFDKLWIGFRADSSTSPSQRHDLAFSFTNSNDETQSPVSSQPRGKRTSDTLTWTMIRNDLSAYTRALWKHWRTLVSGVGSILLSAVSAYLKIPLPYWSFWIVAIGFFFVASFLVWRDESQARHAAQSEVERLQVPKYTSDRKRLAHADLDRLEKS